MGIDFLEILHRFVVIMKHDYLKGNGIFRILWKSALRWYRLGWDGMLEWLDKEIWKIPNNQKKLKIDLYAYQRWIALREPLQFHSEVAESDIKFSIILSGVVNKFSISRVIDSLIAQRYTHWELWVVADSFDAREWNDHRILCISQIPEQSYVAQCNMGLVHATGTWIIFTDGHMIFSPYALAEMALSIRQNPDAELIYSDEDIIDEEEKRGNPHFKSDFNPDLLYSISYIGKAFGCKTSIVRDLGGYRESADRCPEYDFVLRMYECERKKTLIHIPKVLYHFRKDECDVGTRSECERQVLREYFERLGQNVEVSVGLSVVTHRVEWHLPKNLPIVSIIIPTRDHVELLRQCIESIQQKTHYPCYEIIVVDNQSEMCETTQYLDELSKMAAVKILKYNKPFNYSAINNHAVSQANGEIIVLLNNDVEVISPNWLDEMVSHCCREEIGCVGAMLYYPDDTIQHAGVILGLGDVAGHAHKYMRRGSSGYFSRACMVQNFSAVTAACLAVRKSVYEEVGGLDEKNLTVAYNDVDFCLKVQKKGYRNVWTPYAELYHHESKSRGKDNTPAKKARYLKEVSYMQQCWRDVLTDDPYYHKNFSKTAEQFQLRRMEY